MPENTTSILYALDAKRVVVTEKKRFIYNNNQSEPMFLMSTVAADGTFIVGAMISRESIEKDWQLTSYNSSTWLVIHEDAPRSPFNIYSSPEFDLLITQEENDTLIQIADFSQWSDRFPLLLSFTYIR